MKYKDRHHTRQWLLRAGSIVLTLSLLLAGAHIPALAENPEAQPALVILEENDQDVRKDMQTKLQLRDETESKIIPNLEISPVKRDYTIMIYMVGSDLESRNGAATSDLHEIAESGIDFDQTNVIVYAGGTRRWNTDVPVTQNSVLDMSRPEDDRIIACTESNADMGAPSCLSNFINFCETTYPADHYGLILWDHGGGPIYGYGFDELFDSDSLLLQEMRTAMEQTSFSSAHPLDFVGFDACLMGTLETALIWKDYARFLIASEETEAGPGWDYQFLSAFNTSTDTKELSSHIVDTYAAYYEAHKTWSFDPDVTLSVLDLAQIEPLHSAFDALIVQIQKDFTLSAYAMIRRAASDTKGFGLAGLKNIDDAYDLLDLHSFCEQIQEQYPEETASVKEALSKAVLENRSNVEDAHGLAFYLPYHNRNLVDEKEPLETVLTGAYETFVDSYVKNWDQGTQVDWTLAEPTSSADGVHLQLTPEQIENADRVVYTLMSRVNDNYTFYMCNIQVDIDADGTVSIPPDPTMFSAVIDTQQSPTPWQVVQKQSSAEGQTYSTLNANLMNGGEFFEVSVTAPQEVSLLFRQDPQGIHILDVISDNGSALLSEKDSIDVSRYSSIADGPKFMFQISRGADGSIDPYYDWTWNGYSYNTIPIDQSFTIVEKRASDYDMDLVGQFLIHDINGNVHASELGTLPKHHKTVETISTENGELQFEIHDTEAVLVSYEGTDTEVQIPAKVQGKPVTRIANQALYYADITKVVLPDTLRRIGDSAFLGCYDLAEVKFNEGLEIIEEDAFEYCMNLSSIQLPASLKKIGSNAFRSCALSSVTLPDGLEEVGAATFGWNETSTEILISDNAEHFCSVDGVLFSKDKKTLVQYPTVKGASYEIPQGTEVIAAGAFAGAKITHVDFPEGLKTIQHSAFLDVQDLDSLVLPASLVEIGGHAFQGDIPYSGVISSKVTDTEPLGTVTIGPDVEYIGESAFTNRNIQAFEVDEDNTHYASAGGIITDVNQTQTLHVPNGAGAVVTIPDGITTLNADTFAGLPLSTEFIIPDSVYIFSQFAFGSEYVNDERVHPQRFHCNKGSAAEAYAQQYGFAYDDIMDPELLKHETIVIPTEKGEMTFETSSLGAALVSYIGEDEVLQIPEEAGGRPVTQIAGFFDRTNVREVHLPASLEWISPDAYGLFYYATVLTVGDASEHLMAVDNVLFTGDGKTLLLYAPSKTDAEYVVPEGTKTIGQ